MKEYFTSCSYGKPHFHFLDGAGSGLVFRDRIPVAQYAQCLHYSNLTAHKSVFHNRDKVLLIATVMDR